MSVVELVPFVSAPPGWACTSARSVDDRCIELVFERPGESDPDFVRVRVSMDPGGRAFARWPHCFVRYEGRLARPDAATKDHVSQLLESVGARVNRWLGEDRARTAGQLFARRDETRLLDASLDVVQQWLGIPRDGAIHDGYALLATSSTTTGLRVTFERKRDAKRVSLILRSRELVAADAELDEGQAPSPAALTLRTLVRACAQRHPVRVVALTPTSAAHATSSDTELKLQINSPCQQSCEFCSIPKARLEEVALAPLLEAIESGARRGLRALRITGIDPLSFSGIVDVLRAATAAGYTAVEIHSPSVGLADADLCRRIVEALPTSRRFHVPVFGADAATHDAIVGVPGSYVRVLAALDNLERLVGKRQITVHVVTTRNVLASVPSVVRFARDRDLALAVDLPFPDTEALTDRFRQIAPRQSEVVDALLESDLSLKELTRVSGLAPCVLHGRLDPARAAELRAMSTSIRPPPTGIRTPLLRCRHRDVCSWGSACSGEVLRSYVALHGDDELVPLG